MKPGVESMRQQNAEWLFQVAEEKPGLPRMTRMSGEAGSDRQNQCRRLYFVLSLIIWVFFFGGGNCAGFMAPFRNISKEYAQQLLFLSHGEVKVGHFIATIKKF